MVATHANTAAMNITKNGWTLKHCPATSNLPTTMSQGAWDSLCKATMQREIAPSLSGNEKSIKSLCSICRGKTPPSKLTIIDLKKENDMQPKKDKRGACEACGDVLLLKLSNGKQLCGKCSTIYSNTRNWLPVVEASLIHFYPERYESGDAHAAAPVTTGSPSVIRMQEQLEIEKRRGDSLSMSYNELSQAFDDYRVEAEHKERLLKIGEEGLEAIRRALGHSQPDFDIVEEIVGLLGDLQGYKARCEELVAKCNRLEGECHEGEAAFQVLIDNLRLSLGWTEEPSSEEVLQQACVIVAGNGSPSTSTNIDKHLLDLAKVFLKNPNAGCDEVADWIDVVREAA